MSVEGRHVSIVALNGENYPTWKLQCKMALVREGLWGIVSGTEECPDPTTEAEKHTKYLARRDRALATIVLAIETSLLYLLGDPQDPAIVWEQLSQQFQENMGKQTQPQEKVLHNEVKGGGLTMKKG